MGEKYSRRDFLRQAAITGVAIAGTTGVGSTLAAALGEKPATISGKSRVVSVTNKDVINLNGGIEPGAVKKMLGQGIARLAGTKSESDGWKKYFKPSDVVGVKINCLFGKGASTHPEVVDAVVAGLISAGVKPGNIIVWDRSTGDLVKCGYTINTDGAGPKYCANDGEWGEEYELGSFKGKLTTILTDKITALVNIPILKNHGIAGITCALKNHYGSFHNPGQYHGDGCNPYLADINALAPIKDKTRLVVVDAIRPLADGGPQLKNAKMLWDYHSLLVSADPVATDYIGWQIIEKRREELGLEPLTQPAKWLAAATARGIGFSDPEKIELIKI
ncbi:MAG: DUF362 domain-containing protein [Armatimonadota bacterium]|nr:DUF362 domain-containing protein [Armatimonadota bacterium]